MSGKYINHYPKKNIWSFISSSIELKYQNTIMIYLQFLFLIDFLFYRFRYSYQILVTFYITIIRNMKSFLIVGAGPVGLAAAYFLSTLENTQITIIEKLPERPTQQPDKYLFSKALHFNIRSLQIFQNTPIQGRIIEQAVKCDRLRIHSQGKPIVKTKLKQILSANSSFQCLFFLPQIISENIFEKEVNQKGIKVNYGQQLYRIKSNSQKEGVEVVIHDFKTGQFKHRKFTYVIAADGSKSTVRKELGLKMEGQTSQNTLYLGDYQLEGNDYRVTEIIRFNTTILIILPITNNVVRFVSNVQNFEKLIPHKYKWKKCLHSTKYQINNRVIQKLQVGNIFFTGDAAHVHAPIGGRGMNMGIEDAYVLYKLFQANKQSSYHERRKQTIDNFVNQVRNAQKFFLSVDNYYVKAFIFWFLPYLMPLLRQRAVLFFSGLDYKLPELQQTPKL